MDNTSTELDYLLVGGGLQSGLLALALRRRQPKASVCIVERAQRLGGNHTWCFHGDQVASDDLEIIDGLVERSWPSYEVRFPRHQRILRSSYSMVSSDSLRRVVTEVFRSAEGCSILLNSSAVSVGANTVALADGQVIGARVVIDARGPERRDLDLHKTGYQKFVGLELRTKEDHGLLRPILMDAQVEQIDGFRFVYVLPLSSDRLLIEDTRFSDGPELDVETLTAKVREYASERGYHIAEVLRAEQGVLPLPWAEKLPAKDIASNEAISAGYAGGWFHPVTGYSFPVALRVASHVARLSIDELEVQGLQGLTVEHQRQLRFAYRLNKMLFTWFAPANRYNVLERFYTLNEDVIGRFYALQTTALDRARIFVGRPPRGISYAAAILGRSIS